MGMTQLNLNVTARNTGTGTFGVQDTAAGNKATGLDALMREPTFTFSGANQRGLANGPGLDDDGPPIIVEGRPQRETLSDPMPTWIRVANGDLVGDLPDFPIDDEIVVIGKRPDTEIISDCPKMKEATEKSLDFLYNNSPTARVLIDQMAAQGTRIDARDLPNSDFSDRASYSNGAIYWDPYQGLTGSNGQGGTFTHAPILVLAHEIVHAALRTDVSPAAEQKATELTDQIARELNASTGSDFGSQRINYGPGTLFDVESSFSYRLSITPVGC
jgi:hypothetical protein